MPLHPTDIKILIDVSRMVERMNLQDELTQIAAFTGQDRTRVREYLNGEVPIPTWFKSKLYQKSLELKAGGKNDLVYEPWKSQEITQDIPARHPVHKHLKELHAEIRKRDLEVLEWISNYTKLEQRYAAQNLRNSKHQVFMINYQTWMKKYFNELKELHKSIKVKKGDWLDDLLGMIDDSQDPTKN